MRIRSDGKSRFAGNLAAASILNQNPIFEIASTERKAWEPVKLMKELVESSLRSAAIAPKALISSEKRLLNKKSIKYRKEYVKDFL